MRKYAICRDFFHGFDRSRWTRGTLGQKLSLLPAAQEHVLKPTNGETPDQKKQRFLLAVLELSQAFALAVPHVEAMMARIDPARYEECLKRKGCVPMDFTGRPMRGFVFIGPDGTNSEADLASWLDLALDFNPRAKASKKRR